MIKYFMTIKRVCVYVDEISPKANFDSQIGCNFKK